MNNLELNAHHFAITTSHYEETIERYVKKLGCTVFKEFIRANGEGKVAMLQLGNIYIEIFHFDHVTPLPEYRKEVMSDLHVEGTKHFAFGFKDFYGKVAELKERGVEFVGEPAVGGIGKLYVFFRDNNGILLELFEA